MSSGVRAGLGFLVLPQQREPAVAGERSLQEREFHLDGGVDFDGVAVQ